MAVVLSHHINGQSATSVDPDYVVFPAAQEISISGPSDTITPVDNTGSYVPLATAARQDTGNADLAIIAANFNVLHSTRATEATVLAVDNKLTTVNDNLEDVHTKLDDTNSNLSDIEIIVSTSAKQDTGNTNLASIDGKVATAAKQDTGNTSLASIDSKVATAAKQDTGNTSLASIDGKFTTLNAKDFATQTTLATRLSESDFDTKTGSLTETAPTTDTASSGLNGRLQRIAQRITSLIALIPASLGQKTMVNSFAVTVASDQSLLQVQAQGYQGSVTLASVTATSGSGSVLAANASRKYLLINNPDNAGIWINFGTAAVAAPPSLFISGRGSFIMENAFISTQQIFAIRNNSDVTFTIAEGT